MRIAHDTSEDIDDAVNSLQSELVSERANVEYIAALAIEHLANGDIESAIMCLRVLSGGRADGHAAH